MWKCWEGGRQFSLIFRLSAIADTIFRAVLSILSFRENAQYSMGRTSDVQHFERKQRCALMFFFGTCFRLHGSCCSVQVGNSVSIDAKGERRNIPTGSLPRSVAASRTPCSGKLS